MIFFGQPTTFTSGMKRRSNSKRKSWNPSPRILAILGFINPLEHSSLIYNLFTIKVDFLTKVQLIKYKTILWEVANTLLALV